MDERTEGFPHDEAEQIEAAGLRSRDLDTQLATELERPAPAGDPATARYVRELGERPRLPAQLERELVGRAQAGDVDARAELIEAFLPLIGAVARIYRSSSAVERVELVQEGVVGLLRALERYDAGRGVPFWPYASWWVRQAMQQLVAELTRPVVLSDRALRQLSKIKDARNGHLQRHGGEPTAADLAEATGISGANVSALLVADRVPRGLEEPVAGDEGVVSRFGDLLVDPLSDDEYERVLSSVQVEQLRSLLSGLSDRERMVLRARFGLDGPEQSRTEIAQRLGVSAERVRQLEQRGLGKLRTAAGEPPDQRGGGGPSETMSRPVGRSSESSSSCQ